MPQLPTTQTIFAEPLRAQQDIPTSPNMFGAQPAAALSNLGDAGQKAAAMFQSLQNEKDATAANANAINRFNSIKYDPQTGYFNKEGQAAVSGYSDAASQMQKAFDAERENLTPEAQRMYDQTTRRWLDNDLTQMAAHAGRENKVSMVDASESRVAALNQDLALNFNDPKRRELALAGIDGETMKIGELKGWSTEQLQREQMKARGSALSAATLQAEANGDFDTAQKILDTYRDTIPAEHQAMLSERIDSHRLMALQRAVAMEARADAQAERQLKQRQTANEAQLMADVIAGKDPDTHQLAAMLRRQDLSPTGFNAIIQAREGHDDPQAAVHLWSRLTSDLTQPDIDQALTEGAIGGHTAVELTRSLDAHGRAGAENPVAKAWYEQLKTALGGNAVEKGIVDLGNAQGSAQVRLWANAQGEWNRRVLVGKEDPASVAADMMARYQKTQPVPAEWPRPRMGEVNSLQDVASVWQKTKDALTAQTLTQDQYREEVDLLGRYKKYYEQQATRKQAQAATGGGGAKVVGVKPESD